MRSGLCQLGTEEKSGKNLKFHLRLYLKRTIKLLKMRSNLSLMNVERNKFISLILIFSLFFISLK